MLKHKPTIIMHTTARTDNNFGITEADFLKIVSEVQEGNNQGFEQIFLAHFEDCMNYLKRRYKAAHEDAYDASMESLLYFHKRLQEGKIHYGNLQFLWTKMASQHYLRRVKSAAKRLALSQQEDTALSTPELDEEDLMILDKAWKSMKERCRHLLRLFYYEKRSSTEIAQSMDKSPAAVRKRKQRCVEGLRTLFMELSK